MAKLGDAPRRAALALLSGVRDQGLSLAEQLTSDGPLTALDPSERARAQRLANAVFRDRPRADRLIDTYINRPPAEEVRDILRLGVIELCVDHASPHGVVDGAVSLTRSLRKHAAASGMVNAVLRKISKITPQDWASMPVPRLPIGMRKRLRATYKEAIDAIEAAHHAAAPLDITVKSDPESWAKTLEAEMLVTGSLRLQNHGQVSALPGFAEGAWWVQDAAAAIAVRLLAPQAGERIADLCAAPGGKTLQLAASGAQVTAVDVSDARLERLHENLVRTGLSAKIVAGDVLTYAPEALFDAIVLDAPCSATGTIRRHPDLPFLKTLKNLGGLLKLQAAMIDHAANLLKPGGRMVFCTCSLLPEEGEQQIKAALDRNPDLTLSPIASENGIAADWITKQGALRLRPDYWATRGGMDGFFVAILDKSIS